jgi:hypothetical protein
MAKSRYAAPHLRIIAEKKEEEIVVWEVWVESDGRVNKM